MSEICQCKKPCGKSICCSKCTEVSECNFRCKTCVPDVKLKDTNEEPKNQIKEE